MGDFVQATIDKSRGKTKQSTRRKRRQSASDEARARALRKRQRDEENRLIREENSKRSALQRRGQSLFFGSQAGIVSGIPRGGGGVRPRTGGGVGGGGGGGGGGRTFGTRSFSRRGG